MVSPVAGATLPVLAFFFLGIYGINVFLIIASLILGVGHIGIHVVHEKEARESDDKLSMSLCLVMIGHKSGIKTEVVSGARYEIGIIVVIPCRWNEVIDFCLAISRDGGH